MQPLADVLENSDLKNFVKFIEKHLCRNLFLIKIQANPTYLFKNDPCTGVFLKKENKKKNTFKNSLKARSLMVSNLRSETKGSRFEFRSLAMCRGKLFALSARLIFV